MNRRTDRVAGGDDDDDDLPDWLLEGPAGRGGPAEGASRAKLARERLKSGMPGPSTSKGENPFRLPTSLGILG